MITDRTGQVWDLDTSIGARVILVLGKPMPDKGGGMHPVFDLLNGMRSTSYEPFKLAWEDWTSAKRLL